MFVAAGFFSDNGMHDLSGPRARESESQSSFWRRMIHQTYRCKLLAFKGKYFSFSVSGGRPVISIFNTNENRLPFHILPLHKHSLNNRQTFSGFETLILSTVDIYIYLDILSYKRATQLLYALPLIQHAHQWIISNQWLLNEQNWS